MTFNWSGSETNSLTGNAGGTATIQRVEGVQSVGSYSITWSNSGGGTKTNIVSTLSPSTPAPRFSLWADPGNSQSGTIKGQFSNQRPNMTLSSPTQGQSLEDNTPAFLFSYSDPDGDAQRAFQLQIASDAAFGTLVYDSGQFSSTSTAFDLPAANALRGGTYYWRVRAADIYTTGGQWGNWSSVRSFTNTTAPDIYVSSAGTEIVRAGSLAFADVDRYGSTSATVAIENRGSDTLRLDGMSITPAGTFALPAPPSFPVNLTPGQTTSVVINFVPAALGRYEATLSIPGNDPDESPYTIKLSGRCVDYVFRYKDYLYSRDGLYVYGKLGNMSQYWGDYERAQAAVRVGEFQTSLAAAPANQAKRWLLLDVCHDIAMAELTLAQEKVVAGLQSAAGITPSVPYENSLLAQIGLLEEARVLYGKALQPYFDLMKAGMGVNTQTVDPTAPANTPFGYYVFNKEVPGRSLVSPLRRDALGNFVLPSETGTGLQPVEVLAGWKDLTLLLQIEKERLQATSRLAQLYLFRRAAEGSSPALVANVQALLRQTLQASYVEVTALLDGFGISRQMAGWANLPLPLRDNIESWQQATRELTHYETYLRGTTNPLGFPEGLLVLFQSQIPGDPSSQYFNSYDFLAEYLMRAADGPLAGAIVDLNAAKTTYANYRDRQDQLAGQLRSCRQQYDERLRQITGASYGTTSYDTPFENAGSELSLQQLLIDQAQLRVQATQQAVSSLVQQVQDEIARAGQARGIKDAMSKIALKYGNKMALVTEEIGAISAQQTYIANLRGIVGTAKILAGLEAAKGMLSASQQRLAANQQADLISLEIGLLDADSNAIIKGLILRMDAANLDTLQAAIQVRVEEGKLSALLNEKEELERLRIESNEQLAQSYFADPAHRLLKDQSLVRAELSFQRSQWWLHLAVKALEYKWNQTFSQSYNGRTYTAGTLFALQNAAELKDMYDAMSQWNMTRLIGNRNDDGYKVFSLRDDFLGFARNLKGFQKYLTSPGQVLEASDPENELGVRALRVTFNTVKERPLFFRRERWLEKINFMRIKVLNSGAGGQDTMVDGYLKYGGTSYIRNRTPGTVDPQRPDKLLNEMTAYPVRHWFYDDTDGWQSKESYGSYVALQVAQDPSVPDSVYQIDTFKELSVATSEWTLFIGLEDTDGYQVVNPAQITDILVQYHFYWYNRQ